METNVVDEVAGKLAPRFIVTPAEFEKSAMLEAELNRLDLQLTEARPQTRRDRLVKSRAAYQANPSAANLLALDAAEHGKATMSQGVHALAHGALRLQVLARYQQFVSAEVIPWARPIVERGLALERRRFELVEAAENEKHVALCGHPMCQSHVITAARTPLTAVERINSSLKHTDAGILRQHLFRALENFR
jgi:hypothetical protein